MSQDKKKSYSVAPSDPERSGILNRGTLATVVGVAVLALVLVFPKDDLMNRLRSDDAQADRELTVAYLRNLIRTENKDASLRLLLAEKLIAGRQFDEAAQVLVQTRAMALDESDRQRWDELDTLRVWTQYRLARENADLPREVLERIEQSVLLRLQQQLTQANTPRALFALVAQARDLGAMAQAIGPAALQRLAKLPNATLSDLFRGGKEALALSAFELSAALFFAAKTKTADTQARDSAVDAGIKSLLAGGLAGKAYEAALRERPTPPPGDPLHWDLLAMALAANQAAGALVHLRAAVDLSAPPAALAQAMTPQQLALALQVTAASADLGLATRLTQALALTRPGDVALTERVAQLFEWGGKPTDALRTWLAALRSGKSELATANIFRLAPMLFDDDALLAAWSAKAARQVPAMEDVRRIVDIYERMGAPERASEFLAAQRLSQPGLGAESQAPGAATLRQQQLRSLSAALFERRGLHQLAIDELWSLRDELIRQEKALGATDSTRLVTLLLRATRQREALNVLLELPVPSVAPTDKLARAAWLSHWQLRADLGFDEVRAAVWTEAVGVLIAASQPAGEPLFRPYETERLMRHLIDSNQPLDAIALAQQLLPWGLSENLSLAWLDAVNASPSPARLGSFLKNLSATLAQRLQERTDYLERRAGAFAAVGDKARAAADYRLALSKGASPSLRATYWWLLIDMADVSALRRELRLHATELRASPAFWEVLGATHQRLDEPRAALGYYRRLASPRSSDPLWLTNYADVLSNAGDESQALRVRRHAHALLGRTLLSGAKLSKDEAAQAVLLRARLSESFASGSEKTILLRLLGQAIGDDALSAPLREQARQAVLPWALAAERNELARRWLQVEAGLDRRMAVTAVTAVAAVAGASTPAAEQAQARGFKQLALALATGDLVALDNLLANPAMRFSAIDTVNAQRQLGRTAQALGLAQGLQAQSPEGAGGDELALATQEMALGLASRVRVSASRQSVGDASQRTQLLQINTPLNPHLRLSFDLGTSSITDASARKRPEHAQTNARATLTQQTDSGEWSASLARHGAWATVTGLALKLSQHIAPRWLAQLDLKRREPSTQSTPLAIAGTQDLLKLALNHSTSGDFNWRAEVAKARFHTQPGEPLGDQKTLAFNASYALRRQYPELGVRAGVQRTKSQPVAQPYPDLRGLTVDGSAPDAATFLGPSATSWQMSVAWGQSVAPTDAPTPTSPYSRAPRPYAELGAERRRSAGQTSTSALLRLGARGSVFGRDNLTLGIEIRPTAGQTTKELKVHYEWLGDR